jgi:N-acetylmuramoyl-L-alanine amidase
VVHRDSGVAESPINLAVSLKLKEILMQQKFNVVLTRDHETQEQMANHKELKRRIDVAVSNKADMFVSIHVNQYPDSSCFGAQCFYNPQKPESKLLALLIQEELKALEPENFREALPQDLFILRESPMPAVLVEMGFISNPSDRQKLQDPSYQEKIAKAIAAGINRYFNKDTPKHTPEYN